LSDIIYGKLGLTCGRGNVEIELHKLLLYEEGTFFHSHQDSRKTKGIFGTLVVALPSQHQGGTVALKHKDEEYFHDSSKTLDFGTSIAAWYSDVFHEVQKVTSGYRLALIYNLVQTGTLRPQKAADFGGNRSMKDALTHYDKALVQDEGSTWDPVPPFLIYRLDHPYTDESIGVDSLHGNDYFRVSNLQDACEDIGFHLYLATYSKELQFDEDCGDEVFERITGFDVIYDMNGTKVDAKPKYQKDNLLESGYDTAEEEADESEHEGYTGNEGVPFYRRYKGMPILTLSKR
jgi:hypothetical protein